MIVWDKTKREKNLRNHGIDLAEVACVFDAPMVTVEDVREHYGEQDLQSWAGFATESSSSYGRSAMTAPV